MAKPAWSELAAEFGLYATPRDTPTGRQPQTPTPRGPSRDPAAPEPSPAPEVADDEGEDGAGSRAEDEVEEFALADRPVDDSVDPAPVGSSLELSGAEVEALDDGHPPTAGPEPEERFTELGLRIAQVMQVAYDAMGEMKRLERRLDGLRETHAALGRTLAKASEDLHRSLEELDITDG